MHQRSCRVIRDLEEETFESLEQNNLNDTGQNDDNIDWDSLPTIKQGITLPKSDEQWKLANKYFAALMPSSKSIKIILL